MRFEKYSECANQANLEFGQFRKEFILRPEEMRKDDYVLAVLNWESIHFGNDDEMDKIPDDKRGVYAFVICHPSKILPPHGYVIYIGMAGRRSNRSLRARYKDYLNEKLVAK